MKKLLLLTITLLSVYSYAITVSTWTSTCGVQHKTTYPDNWSQSMIENDIKNINETQCGVRPTKITVKVTKGFSQN